MVEGSRLTALYSQYLAVWQSLDPEGASALGLHEFDNKLTSYDDATYLKIRSNLERFDLLLRTEVHPDLLKPEDRVDYDLFRDALELGLAEYDRGDVRKIKPQLYMRLSSVHQPMTKDYGAVLTRAFDALDRLDQYPAHLQDARRLIGHPPRIWTQEAVDECTGALAYLKTLPSAYEPLYGNDALLEPRLKPAVENMRDAIEQYRSFLKDTVLPRSDGEFAVGREAYDRMVRLWHHQDLDAGKIESIGRAEMRRAKRLLKKEARSIDRERDWWDQLEDAEKEHPAADKVIAALQAEVQRAGDQVRKLDLAALPAGPLSVASTPAFLRPVVYLFGYSGPPPLDTSIDGQILVTPVDPALPDDQKAALLAEGFNSCALQNVAASLAYPGRHVESGFLKQQSSLIRRSLGTPVLSEGWALYAEDLAYESGFYTSELARLTQLRRRLVAAARAVVDVRLHTKGMTPEEAEEFLVKETRIPTLQARSEVLRITNEPTWGMSAIVGYQEIEKLRDRVQHIFGSDFQLREFHDHLLSYGPISPRTIETLMEKDWFYKE